MGWLHIEYYWTNQYVLMQWLHIISRRQAVIVKRALSSSTAPVPDANNNAQPPAQPPADIVANMRLQDAIAIRQDAAAHAIGWDRLQDPEVYICIKPTSSTFFTL